MNHPGVALILATGGNAMVRAAYSCGKPALGVGAGNVPAYIEKTAKLKRAVNDVVLSKAFDNGMVCASEQAVILDDADLRRGPGRVRQPARLPRHRRRRRRMLEEFIFGVERRRRELRRRQAQRRPSSASRPQWIAEQAGFTVPEDTSIILAEVSGVGPHEPLTREKLAPVLAVLRAETAEHGIAARRADGRVRRPRPLAPPSTPRTQALIEEFGSRVKAVRVIGNSPVVARRHRRHLQRLHPVAHARLRLVRPQLGLQQRLGGEPVEHQADRPPEQQPAVVQGAGQDLLRAERDPLPRGHARRRARHHRHRRDDDHASASSTRSSTCSNRRAEQGRAADHRPGRARADRRRRSRPAPSRCATSSPTRSSRSAAARRWTPRRSCGCCTSTPRSTSPTCSEKFFDVRKRAFKFPDARRAGQARLHPDHVGHRRRGDAVRGHHRPGRRARSTRSPTTR